jgi:hypothetical protein
MAHAGEEKVWMGVRLVRAAVASRTPGKANLARTDIESGRNLIGEVDIEHEQCLLKA